MPTPAANSAPSLYASFSQFSGYLRAGSMAALVAALAACSANPSASPAGATTQIPSDQLTPGASTPVQAPPIDANSTDFVVSAGMSIGSAAAVDMCLAVDPNNPNQPLSLTFCTMADNQRFVYVNGLMQSAFGRCIEVGATTDLNQVTTTLAACDPNRRGQLIERLGDQLLVTMNGRTFMLATLNPPRSGVATLFLLNSFSGVTSSWTLGRYSHGAQNNLTATGTSLGPTDDVSQCFTAGTGVPYLSDCTANNADQAWEFAGGGTIRNKSMCLQANGTGVATAMCSGDPNQNWLVNAGLISNAGAGTCLTLNTNGTAMQICGASTRSFVIGAQQ